jgi:mRNA interferase MazF
LVVVVPLTSVDKRIPLHVEIEPPEGGLSRRSWVKPEDVRSVSVERLGVRLGSVSAETLATVEGRLRVLLDL